MNPIINKEQIKRILIIQFRYIGDIILSTPLIKILRESFPQSHIAFLVEPLPGELLEDNPNIDEIIYFEKRKDDIIGSYKFFRSLKNKKFDLVIDLVGTPGTAWATFFSKAKYKVGYNVRIRKYAYNLVTSDDTVERYSALKKLVLLKKIGIYKEEHKLFLKINENHRKFAEDFFNINNINDDKLKMFFAPNSKIPTKRWTKERFAELGDLLNEKYQAHIIMLWGNPEELKYTREIAELMNYKPVLMPKVMLKEMAAVIEKCDLMVACDSGPKHIGTAMEIPTVTIFGSSMDILWNPPGNDKFVVVKGNVPCIGCGLNKCDHMSCMDNIKVKDIENAMMKLKQNGYLLL